MATRADIPGIGTQYFPDSMSDEEIYKRIDALKANQAHTQPVSSGVQFDPKDQYLKDIFTGGLHRSLANAASGVTDVIPSMWASATGNEEEAKSQLAERQEKLKALEEEYPTAYKSYKEVKDIPS